MSIGKVLSIAFLTLILLLTATGTGFAQDTQPPKPLDVPTEPPFFPPGKYPLGGEQMGSPIQSESNISAQALTLGAVGLSFSYSKTFGVVETPYISDTNHINHPWGIGIDNSGNVMIGEYLGRRVLTYTSAGAYVSSIGRAGVAYQDGEPRGVFDIAVDSSNNIWVADNDSGTVIKYDSSNAFVEFFHNDGTFSHPAGIAFDASGNMYVSDGGAFWTNDIGRHHVLIFNSTGDQIGEIGVTDESGAGNDHLYGPQHLAISGSMLYIADSGNQRVQIFDISTPSAPIYFATLGTTGEGGWDNTHFDQPAGIAVDGTYIYVADRYNHRIQIFNKTTRAYVNTVGEWGTGDYQFKDPSDLTIDSAGNIYVADFENTRVQQFSSSFVYQRTYGMTGVPYVTTDGLYNSPSDIAVAPDGSMYITEDNGHRLIKLNADGSTAWAVGAPGIKFPDWPTPTNRFNNPADIAISATGKIYFADRWNNRVLIYNPDGTYAATLGGGSGSNDNFVFSCPTGLAIGKNGNIYVTDCWRQRVQIFSSTHAYVGTLGVTDTAGSDNDHFNDPEGVAVDSNGFIYVADSENYRVQVFDASRHYVRTMGVTGVNGSSFDKFEHPERLAVDSSNRLYVSDAWNNSVQVFDASGAYLTTVGGYWGNQTGRLRWPQGLTVDQNGALYIADENNQRIQKYVIGAPNWDQTNLNGFGDRGNHISTLASFNGQIYAGTYNFNGNGAQLWRSSDGKNWSIATSNGFGDPENGGIDHLIEFNGKLYAGTWNQMVTSPYTSHGGQIWRSSDGSTWEQVVNNGFGEPAINGEVMHMAVFNNKIYASTWSYDTTKGTEIWRSDTGDSGSWTKVVDNGRGDATNDAVLSMETFNGYLYAGVHNWDYNTSDSTGSKIWRTADGVTWTEIVSDGFGNSNSHYMSLKTFGDSLYYGGVGSWLDAQTPTGGQVWKCTAASNCDSASDWVEMNSDGFGNPKNQEISSMRVFSGRLYAVTINTTTGMEVWQTSDGADWQQAGTAGFGDSNNPATYYDNAVAVFNNHLFIGTTNGANGGEVWSNTFAQPAAFNKMSPLNGANNVPINLSLQWNASSGATSYEICYDTHDNDLCDTTWIKVGISRSIELRGLDYATPYYWQVRARNAFADTYANDNSWRSFTTGGRQTVALPSINANDGWTLESSEFSNVAGSKSNSGDLLAGDDARNRQYRSLLFFDTAGLPDNAIISSATLEITKHGALLNNPFSLGSLIADMKSGFFGLSPLELGDFSAIAAPINPALNTFSTSDNTLYQVHLSPLTFKYINLRGVTQFRIRFSKDDNNNKKADIFYFYDGNGAIPPQFTIEYIVP